jgi:hypothetical protein
LFLRSHVSAGWLHLHPDGKPPPRQIVAVGAIRHLMFRLTNRPRPPGGGHTKSGGTPSRVTVGRRFQTPPSRIVVGGQVVVRRLPWEANLNDGVPKITMLRNKVLVVLPVLDGHDRRLVLGLEPPHDQFFRRVGVTGHADNGSACPDRTVPIRRYGDAPRCRGVQKNLFPRRGSVADRDADGCTGAADTAGVGGHALQCVGASATVVVF